MPTKQKVSCVPLSHFRPLGGGTPWDLDSGRMSLGTLLPGSLLQGYDQMQTSRGVKASVLSIEPRYKSDTLRGQ